MSEPKTTIKPEDQKAFLDYDRERRIRLTKIGCVLAFVLMPLGTSLDQQVYPAMVHDFMKIRLLVSALSALIWIFLTWKPTQRFYILWGLILPLMPLLSINWMIYRTDGVSSPFYAGLLLVSVPMALLLPWTFWENLLMAVLTVGCYVWVCLARGPVTQVGIFYSHLYFLINTILICVIGTYFTSRLRLSEFMARHHLDASRRELEASNQKLRELDQMKSRFFANISHELRTPLTMIIAPLEALKHQKAEGFDTETRMTLQTMTTNAMRLLKLINDLLDLVKLESGGMEVKRELTAIDSFLRGLAQSVSGVARDKRIEVTVSAPVDLGLLRVDRDKLEKIILNLVFNALKFTPAGGRVMVKAEKRDGRLILQVVDTGMGISEGHLPYIFDRFWQADSAANQYQGTGIGLALVKELTELQGGEVRVESRQGKGTTMTIDLPLLPEPENALPSTDSALPEDASEPEEWLARLYRRAELFPVITSFSDSLRPEFFGKSGKPRILVADDEIDILNFLKSQLSKDYEVLEAVDGNQAVEKIRQFHPEIVIMDMMMPNKDGIEACIEVKRNLATQSIPILLLTAKADDDTKLAALKAGASDFLTKPFSSTELNVRVRNLVAARHFQVELENQNKKLEAALEQLKDTEATLVQTEKMSSLGRMSAGMIHEVNNPLNYALAALNLFKSMRDKWPEDQREKWDDLVADIQEGMTRVQGIVTDLRGFTDPHHRVPQWFGLREVVDLSMRFVSHEIGVDIHVDIQVPGDQRVFAEKNGLIHVFVNLFQNSVDALKAKKFDKERPSLSVQSGVQGDNLKIWVRDNGTGIPTQYMEKIFDPFFTTKDVGQGMGLGLSICYRMVLAQGGKISVESEQGKYTEFLLEFPNKID